MSAGTVVAELFGAGVLGTVGENVRQLYVARTRRKQIVEESDDKHMDSSIQRSQAALLIMQSTLTAAVSRAESAEATVAELRSREEHLRGQVDELRGNIESLQATISDLAAQLNAAAEQVRVLQARTAPPA